jgi:hypothetical protein
MMDLAVFRVICCMNYLAAPDFIFSQYIACNHVIQLVRVCMLYQVYLDFHGASLDIKSVEGQGTDVHIIFA